MHALIALFVGPVGRWIAGILFVITFCAMLYGKGYSDGGDARQAKFDKANAAAVAGAKQEADRVIGGDRSRVKGFDRE